MSDMKNLLEEESFYPSAALVFGEKLDSHPDWVRIFSVLANLVFTGNAEEQNRQFPLQDGRAIAISFICAETLIELLNIRLVS
jgi:hypothetical protein